MRCIILNQSLIHVETAHPFGGDDPKEHDIRFVMPRADLCWSLRKYINFALTVDEAESSPGSSHVVAATPGCSFVESASRSS